MSSLERKYRRLLLLLPRWYRDEREPELLDALLADTDELTFEYGWPQLREAVGIAGLACRLRFGVRAPARTLTWLRSLRLVGLLALGAHAIDAVLGLLLIVFAVRRGVVPVQDYVDELGATGGWAGWGRLALLMLALGAVGAFLALVHGWTRTGRVLLLLSLIPLALSLWRSPFLWGDLVFWSPVLCLLGGAGARPVVTRPWLWTAALPIGVGGCFLAGWRLVPFAWLGAWSLGYGGVIWWLLGAGVVWLLFHRRMSDPAVPLALAMTAVLPIPVLLRFSSPSLPADYHLAITIQIVGLAVLAVVLGAIGYWRTRDWEPLRPPVRTVTAGEHSGR